jgi:hypothetical protein
MRVLAFSLYLVSSASLRVCDDESSSATGAASAAATAQASAAARATVGASGPRIGGSQVTVGSHAVELLVHASGLAEAIVTDAAGQVVSEGVKLSLVAEAKGGEKVAGKLAFSAPRGRFEGRCRGKGKGNVELSAAPIELSLDVGGKVATATLKDAVIVHGPRFGGQMLVAGSYGVEVLARPSGEVFAFVHDRAGAEVKADAGLDIRANLTGKLGSEEIALRFDPARGCFAGHAKAGAELSSGSLELSLKAGGNAAVGRLARIALLAEATHGGAVVLLGGFSAEIVVKGPDVRLFVVDADGKASADASFDAKVAFGADASEALSLRWDAGCLCYRGSLAANVDLSLQPITVSLVAAGQTFVGAAASLRAAADARLRLQGKLAADAAVDAKAAAGADAKLSADLNAKAPEVKANLGGLGAKVASGVKVDVQAPKVNVQVPKVNATAGTQAGGKAKASAGFQIGTK